MSEFIRHLKTMNRKERYYLLRWAIGAFELSPRFRERVGAAIELGIPPDAYVAMDYHLNWIYAALVLSSDQSGRGIFPNPGVVPGDKETGLVRGNQEDIDLIIAFERDDISHLVMLEAKGTTPWSPRQLDHKARRLKDIFVPELCGTVQPHFVVTSPPPAPTLPSAVNSRWPIWMTREDNQLRWVPMDIDSPLMAVGRCNQAGKPDAAGEFWTLKPWGSDSIS